MRWPLSLQPAWIAWALLCTGCAHEVPPVADRAESGRALVVGRVVAAITGDTRRMYEPEIRFLELEHRQTSERYRVPIDSDDRYFAIELPAGPYRLNRVQFGEGPFTGIVQLSAEFPVGAEAVTYVGTWRFGLESPRYGRKVAVSMVLDEDGRGAAHAFLNTQYPNLAGVAIVATLPDPSETETRLYEVMPYPRYPRYFQRHVW